MKRKDDLLPVAYHHMVFSLPHCLEPLILQNKSLLYNLLFDAVNSTMTKVAADNKYLGGTIGFISMLHTWSQTLLSHTHIHCLIPSGGISLDGKRWISTVNDEFLPTEVLSTEFHKLFMDSLKRAYDEGKLWFYGELEKLTEQENF